MTTVTKSIVIDAPREAIRPYMFESEQNRRWNPNTYLWEPDPAWPEPGATSRVGFKATGLNVEGVARSLEYDPVTIRHVFQIEASSFEPSTWVYTFDEDQGRTTVTMEVEYTVPGRFLGEVLDKLVVERGNARLVEQSLANLKALVEQELP